MVVPLFSKEKPRKRKGLEAKGLCPYCKSPLENIHESPYASCPVPCDEARLVPRFSRGELYALWVSRLPVAEPYRPDGLQQWRWKISGRDGWWVVVKPGGGGTRKGDIRAKRQTYMRLYIKWFREAAGD